MMKVICCKYLPSRSKIGPRSFSKLFSAKARRALAKAISKRSSKPSNANRKREVICRNGPEEFPPHLNPLPSEGRGGRRRGLRFQLERAKGVASPYWGRGEGEGEELIRI